MTTQCPSRGPLLYLLTHKMYPDTYFVFLHATHSGNLLLQMHGAVPKEHLEKGKMNAKASPAKTKNDSLRDPHRSLGPSICFTCCCLFGICFLCFFEFAKCDYIHCDEWWCLLFSFCSFSCYLLRAAMLTFPCNKKHTLTLDLNGCEVHASNGHSTPENKSNSDQTLYKLQ